MAGPLAAEVGAQLDHLFQDVFVPHLGSDEADAGFPEGFFQSHVAHGRGHDRARLEQAPAGQEAGQDMEGVIAVEQAAVLVGPKGPVGVAVEGNAEIRPFADDGRGHAFWMEGTASGVDVPAVRRRVQGDRIGPDGPEDVGGDARAGSLAAVEDDLETAGQAHALETVDQEFFVIVDQAAFHGRGTVVGRRRHTGLGENGFLEARFPGIGDLHALGRENLDAVVAVGVVRGGDDGAGAEGMDQGQVADPRCRNDPRGMKSPSGIGDAADELRLDPFAGLAGVPADEHFGRQSFFPQQSDQRPSQDIDGRPVQRIFAGDGPHSVGSEKLFHMLVFRLQL